MTQWIVQTGIIVAVAISGATAGGILALLLRKLLHGSLSIAFSLLIGVGLSVLLFVLPIVVYKENYTGKFESLWQLFSLEMGIIFVLIAWVPNLKR